MTSWTHNRDDWQNASIKKTWEYDPALVPDWFKKTTVTVSTTQNYLNSEQMIKSILNEAFEEKGFFQDIIEWLRRDAPKKLREALLWIYPLRHANLTYKHLCELVYRMGFRASERTLKRTWTTFVRAVPNPKLPWVVFCKVLDVRSVA